MHFGQSYPFSEILDIYFYEDEITHRTFFQSKRSFKIINNNTNLITGVKDFLSKNGKDFKSDEFMYIIKTNSSFETLIEKIPIKNIENRYISFGYKKLDHGNYVFLIDIHNIGKIKAHADLFSLLFNNTLKFMNKDI